MLRGGFVIALATALVAGACGGDGPVEHKNGGGGVPLEHASGGAGAASLGDSGAPSEGGAGGAVIAILGEAGPAGQGGGSEPSAAELQIVADVCAEECATYAFLNLTGDICEEGSQVYHDVIYPPGAEIPASEPPRNCADPTWVPTCVDTAAHDPAWKCSLFWSYCTAEGVWVCDRGSWGVVTCPSPRPEGC
jgi:hypothetical protein